MPAPAMSKRRSHLEPSAALPAGPVPRPLAPPSPAAVADVLALNKMLARRRLPYRIPVPRDLHSEREAVSTALIATFRATRDARAFELLYRWNEPFVRLLCQARLRRYPPVLDADDLVNETFLTIYRRAHTFEMDRRATFTGWVTRMVENLLIGHLRRPHNRAVTRDVADLADGDHGPLGQAILGEARDRVAAHWPILVRVCAAALLRLPPQMRRVVELRESEDLSYVEIARRLGVARGTAAMLLRRARLRILQFMNQSLARSTEPGGETR